MKNKLLLMLLLVSTLSIVTGQIQPGITLYNYNPYFYNPAATGNANALQTCIATRSMWTGVEGAPRTHFVNAHSPLKNEALSIGMQFMRDNIGVSNRSEFLVSGAYRIKIHKGKLSFGIAMGMGSVNNRWSEVVRIEDNDLSFAIGNDRYVAMKSSAGIFYEDKLWQAGFSVPNLFHETYDSGGTYKSSINANNYSYHLMSARKIVVADQLFIRPSVLLKYHNNLPIQGDLGLAVGTEQIEGGVSYRHSTALCAFVRFAANKQMNIAYGFDHPAAKTFGRSSHELMICYKFLYKTNAPSTRFL